MNDRAELRAINGSGKREPRIRLVPFDQIALGTEPRYLVHGLIPRVGISVIWGPPKSGKSFWTFDLTMHVALGLEYRGRRVQQGPVVYAAFEGQSGIRGRCEAFRQRFLSDQAEGVPFYLEPLQLDLVSDVMELTAAIWNALPDMAPVAIVLDTLNRSLRGSESSDEDMSSYVRAADALREAFECAVLIVHHCGVEASRPRGHTSLTGAAEAQLAVKRDGAGNVIVTVEWMKDGPEGDTITSALETVEVGQDANGETITSCVVVPSEASAMTEARGPRLTPNQQSMLGILDDAGKDGLTLEDWNAKARDNGLGVKRRTDLMDYRKALKDKRLIHSYLDRWYVTR
jgi:hypothetical protein